MRTKREGEVTAAWEAWRGGSVGHGNLEDMEGEGDGEEGKEDENDARIGRRERTDRRRWSPTFLFRLAFLISSGP